MANILLAEDDRSFGTLLKRELEEEEHVVDHVLNGVDAVLKFIINPYDLLLFDLRMPRLTGTDALRIVKQLNPRVPAIAFSGHAGHQEKAEVVNCGAIDCLEKPFEVSRLKEQIRGLFTGKSAQIIGALPVR